MFSAGSCERERGSRLDAIREVCPEGHDDVFFSTPEGCRPQGLVSCLIG